MSDTGPEPAKRIKLDVKENDGDQANMEDFSADLVSTKDEFSMSHDEYIGNQVNPEELKKLKEFQILDEVKSNDEDSEAAESDTSDDTSEIPDEEIEKMLEEDLPEDFKGAPKPKEKLYVIKQKTVLEEKGVNHFEVLPLDWVAVRHLSGMPVYLHKPTRVCTLSKPYFIGQKGSAIKHEIPISAIPCLNYRKALEEEFNQKEIDKKIAEQIKQMTQTRSTNEVCNDNMKNSNNSHCNVEDSTNLIESNDSNAREQNVNTQIINKMQHNERGIENELLEIKFNSENETDKTTITKNVSNNNETTVQDGPLVGTTKKLSCPFSNVSIENGRIKTEVMDCEPNDASNQEQTAINESHSSENGGERSADQEIPLSSQPVVLPGGIIMPPPRVETVNNNWKTRPLTYEQVNEYCRRLFKFKTINTMQFKHWVDRHKYTRMRKALPYSTLPQGTKVITIPAKPLTGQENGANGAIGKANRRDWVMNMNGRSYLCVFHEYVQRALQKQPVYEFKQTENASTPYQATVFIGGMQYGVGYGSSKRQAKSAAARASIHILIPEMKDKLDDEEPTKKSEDDPVFSFFDCVGIEDPRIMEFCASTMEPSPHAILRTCLLRNFGAGDRHIQCETKKLEHQRIELTMKVGKHSATVVCKNKKMAKQRASQAILQALHPHVHSWGSLLRLYGSRSVKSSKEKKLEEQQITLLQDKARHNEPNYAVLEKLRQEMHRLKERDEAVVPIGTLMVTDDLPTHSGSNLNNVDL